MFGMSFFDILSSVAIGLSTLPMPKDLPFPHSPYDGTRLGNVQTCEAQGFMFILGFITVFAYNAMLFIYYTCSIAFQLKEKKIVKFVEPILHIAPIAFGLSVAIPPLIHDLYNPTTWDAWCTIAATGRGKETLNEDWMKMKMSNIDALVTQLCITLIALISVSTALIVWRVMKVERQLQNPRIKRRSAAQLQEATRSHGNTKVVVKQVLAYLLSFAISLGVLLVRSVIVEPEWVIYLSFALMPLQGFFNALIFISHKVYNYRRVYGGVSRCDVIKLLFRGNADEPLLFSRIAMVRMNDDGSIIDIEVSNENGNEVLHINNDDIVSASEFGIDVFIDEESKRDMDGLSAGFSSAGEANSARAADSYIPRREVQLSSFVNELPSSQQRVNFSLGGSQRSSIDLSPSLGQEDGISVGESTNNQSVLSRFSWMSRFGNRANQSVGLSMEPSEPSVPGNEVSPP